MRKIKTLIKEHEISIKEQYNHLLEWGRRIRVEEIESSRRPLRDWVLSKACDILKEHKLSHVQPYEITITSSVETTDEVENKRVLLNSDAQDYRCVYYAEDVLNAEIDNLEALIQRKTLNPIKLIGKLFAHMKLKQTHKNSIMVSFNKKVIKYYINIYFVE
jgi:hypothetical protein